MKVFVFDLLAYGEQLEHLKVGSELPYPLSNRYFKPDVANFQTGNMNGVLKGKTKSGQQIEGSAALKIFSVPTEKSRFKHHDKHGNGRDEQRNGNDKGKR